MYAKKLFIFICFISFPFLSYADTTAYYSNVGPGDGAVRHQHSKSQFSISLNVPTVATTTYTVGRGHSHQPHWVAMHTGDRLPANAVVGGSQSNPPATLYVCQGNYRGGVHPGKLFNGQCNIGWGGREIVLTNYQVLVSRKSLAWVPASDGDVPPNAIDGGYQQDGPLYICQVSYRGGVHPGKIVGQNCNIGWGGAEITIPHYNVLVG